MTAWLLTWLWQGVALAAGVAAALRYVPGLNAATKHLICGGLLVAIAWLGWDSSPYRGLTAVQVEGSGAIYIPSAPNLFITVFIGIWAAVALVNLVRLLPSLHAVYALRDRCRPFPSHVEAQLPLWLEAKAHGRRTELTICDELAGATVLGFQRPCIAIPDALIGGLTPQELDQVILHEHAHVQRRDDWARLLQTLLMSILWIHPAALLVSRVLDREREMACDEWVVARTGSPKAYASCLAHAAEVRGRLRNGLPLVPAFIGRPHDLVRRVERLLTLKNARRKVSLVAATTSACAIVMISAQLHTMHVFAEIAEIVLPIVRVQPVRWVQLVQRVQETRPAQQLSEARDYSRAATRALGARTSLAGEVPDVASIAPAALIAPVAPSLSARAFTGAYSLPDASIGPTAPIGPTASIEPIAPVARTPNASGRWRAVATPGVEIASAAKKTSVGIASVFSRAGVSLARSF
jgi:beta-lactamase regulating signal transducer with metallopeptidase domain